MKSDTKLFYLNWLRSLVGLPPKITFVNTLNIIKYLKQINYKGDSHGK